MWVLHSNDIDIHVGKALSCNIIEEDAFNKISNENFKLAREKIQSVNYVIDTGFVEPNYEFYDAIKEKVPEVYVVGDSKEPRGILEAISDGFEIGRRI